jgi:hypothetical protein
LLIYHYCKQSKGFLKCEKAYQKYNVHSDSSPHHGSEAASRARGGSLSAPNKDAMAPRLLLLLLLIHRTSATVELPGWFADSMVLQTSDEGGPTAFLSGRTLPPAEKVSITGDVGDYSAVSEPGTGLWKVTLKDSATWKEGGATGMKITVQGATGPAVTASGVQAGDVFFCAVRSQATCPLLVISRGNF